MHIGDRVRFKKMKGEGVITKVLGQGMVEVVMDDDFPIEMSLADLVGIAREEGVVFGTGSPTKAEDRKVKPRVFAKEGLFVGIIPTGQALKFYFINNSDFHIGLSCKRLKTESTENLLFQTFSPKTAERFFDWPGGTFSELNFRFDFIYHDYHNLFDELPRFYNFRLTPVLMAQEKIAIPVLKQKGILAQLDMPVQNSVQKIEPTPSKSNQGVNLLNVKKPNRILDLHAEKLFKGRKPDEKFILEEQLKHFEQHFFNCRSSNIDESVYIHGQGEHKLQQALVKWLKSNAHLHKGFEQADYHLYGSGALKVKFT